MTSNTSGISPDHQLAVAAHVKYIQSLDTRKDQYEYWLTEHLRLNGLYWGLASLHLLREPQALPRKETIEFILSCQHENGGFGAAPGHDAHMLYTVSAVQILSMIDALGDLETRGKGKALVGKCSYAMFGKTSPQVQLFFITNSPFSSHRRPPEPHHRHLCRGRMG